MLRATGHFAQNDPDAKNRGLDLRRVPLIWKGGSLGHTSAPAGAARIFMGLSRALSCSWYGETEGGLIQFDRAIGTPFRLVAIRLSRILF